MPKQSAATAEVRPQRAESAQLHVFTETLRGRQEFTRLRAQWNRAHDRSTDPSPVLSHDFLRLWIENFAASATPIVITAKRGDQLAGALPLTISWETVDGVPLRVARGLCNSHSTRGGILLGAEGTSAIPALLHRALEEPWDALVLRDVSRESGQLAAIESALQGEGCTVAFESPMDSPYVPLPATWAELEKRLDARFRQNLRRRRRRLEEHGTVRFETHVNMDGLDAALEDAFSIEAAGWKGREGSAIAARPELVAFYSQWARLLAHEKRLRLSFLTLGDRRIAFQFAFVAGSRCYLPKCGFDDTYAECSPGQLLMADVLKRCCDERLDSFEFLGFSMPWKLDWTPLVRPHATLWAFRGTPRGRLAHLVRARIRPRIAIEWRALRDRVLALRSRM